MLTHQQNDTNVNEILRLFIYFASLLIIQKYLGYIFSFPLRSYKSIIDHSRTVFIILDDFFFCFQQTHLKHIIIFCVNIWQI